MKHLLKFNEELKGKWAEETEIIYKDKNLVCLIPKSQMSSYVSEIFIRYTRSNKEENI